MAGVQLKLEGGSQVMAALNRLMQHGDDLTQPLRAIGEYLDETTKQRFIDQQAPDGTPWEPLSALTLARKQRKDRVLTESGTLADNLHYQLDSNNTLAYGSNEVYGAMHQFGGITSPFSLFPNQEIAARPFLGVAPFEKEAILQILAEHLSNVAS